MDGYDHVAIMIIFLYFISLLICVTWIDLIWLSLFLEWICKDGGSYANDHVDDDDDVK